MQTGTVPSELTGRVKKLKQFIYICTYLARRLEFADLRLGTLRFRNKYPLI